MVKSVGNIPYCRRRRLLQWDDDPDRYSRQSQKVQEHSHWESSCQSPTCQRWGLCDNVRLFRLSTICFLLTHGFVSLIDCLNPADTLSSPSSNDALRIEAAHVIASLSYGLSLNYHTVSPTFTPLFNRFRRGPEYTFEGEHTPCNFLRNFSFHKSRLSASPCSILPRFTSLGYLHRWHCWSFVVGFEKGQFYRSKWCSTSSSVLFPSSTPRSFIYSARLMTFIYVVIGWNTRYLSSTPPPTNSFISFNPSNSSSVYSSYSGDIHSTNALDHC